MGNIIGPNEKGLTYCLDLLDASQLFTPSPTKMARRLPICICSYGYFVAGPGHYTDRDQFRSLYQVFLTHSGCGRFIIDGKEYLADKDTAVFLNCGHPHRYESYKGTWEHEWVNFSGSSCKVYQDLINPDGFRIHQLHGNREPFIIMQEIKSGVMNQDMPGLVQTSTRIIRLLDSLYTLSMSHQRSHIDDMRGNVQLSIDYIDEHYMESVSLDQLAQTAFLSKYYYLRSFKQYTGMTPYEYLTSVRLSHAIKMLVATNRSIDEIGYETGFGGAKNFIRQFRQSMGVTPGDYRKTPGGVIEEG